MDWSRELTTSRATLVAMSRRWEQGMAEPPPPKSANPNFAVRQWSVLDPSLRDAIVHFCEGLECSHRHARILATMMLECYLAELEAKHLPIERWTAELDDQLSSWFDLAPATANMRTQDPALYRLLEHHARSEGEVPDPVLMVPAIRVRAALVAALNAKFQRLPTEPQTQEVDPIIAQIDNLLAG